MSQVVLVVEDQEDNRRIVRDLLTRFGYEVHEATTGIEGVAMAQAIRPDLIIMDVQLPGMNGYDATRQIKATPELAAVPLFIVTSYALAGDEAMARAAGCDAYFAKPVSPMALLARVKEFLSLPAADD